MHAEFEKERLRLKVQTNALNQKAAMIFLAADLIGEYRMLVQQLHAYQDKLHFALNEKENIKPDDRSVRPEAQPDAAKNSDPPSGADSPFNPPLGSPFVERNPG